MTTSFADLGVPADLVTALEREGIDSPFDVQVASIPDALAGRDVLGRAPTGSGKTLAFGIPLIAHLGQAKPRRPKAMVLSPTRELAEQIRRALEPLARVRKRSVLSIYGGVGFGAQRTGLKNGADLIVACPGRLIDLIEQNEVSLDQVDYVVVDEADRMADMGFLPAVKKLLDLTADDRQTVLFSATLDREVQILIDRYQNDPVTHEVGEVEPDLTLVEHRFYKTEAKEKLALAADTIDDAGPTVVFCRTRHGVDRVARQLKAAGIKSGWIHGGRSQSQRDAALHAFTSGKVQCLVATDVAARGIHVDGVKCVIHFDPPAEYKDYVHRSGRTARAGNNGVVVSFINSDQVKAAKKMMKDVGLPPTEIPAPDTSDRAAHIQIELRSRKAQHDKRQKDSARSGGSKAGGGKQEKREARNRRASSDDRAEGRPGRDRTKTDDRRDGRRKSGPDRGAPGKGASGKGASGKGASGKGVASERQRSKAPDVAHPDDRDWSVSSSKSGKAKPGTSKSGHAKSGSAPARRPDGKKRVDRFGNPKPRHRDRDRVDGRVSDARSSDEKGWDQRGGAGATGTRKPGMPKRLRADGTAQPKRQHRKGGKPVGKTTKRSGKPRPKNKKRG